jgi:hypothetical protein
MALEVMIKQWAILMGMVELTRLFGSGMAHGM